ncbi:toxolysin TLN4 [Cryptosporidium felis]|nr:toxolysin TLN4 [Cryptosporidium felis]
MPIRKFERRLLVLIWVFLSLCLEKWNEKESLGLQERSKGTEVGLSYLQVKTVDGNEAKLLLNPIRVRISQLTSLEEKISPQVKPKAHTTSKGIKALLVSDNSMLESAFSFGVGCGYYQDPENVPGLAHLMEHVVFLGSKENPSPVGWDEFLLNKGGASNAYTSGDSTVFYVLTAPTELESVSVYFSKMLTTPVIDEKSSVSEIDAVNQEHEKNIPNKIRNMIELALHLSPENCPARKFGTGSKETLLINTEKENISLKKALSDYHASCYTSENISLVIMGPQSTEELSIIADRIDKVFPDSKKATKGVSASADNKKNRSGSKGFSAKNQHSLAPGILSIFESTGNVKSDVGISSSGLVNPKENQNVEEKPQTDRPNEVNSSSSDVELLTLPRGSSSPPLVMIYWDSQSNSLDILRENAEWQMLKLIQYFFEDQSPNSIASQLQKKKLASSLEYFDNTSSQYSIYGILFTATDESDETTTEIARLTASYMNSLINQVENGGDEWIQSFYKNYTNMASIEYEFDEERDTAGIVSQAAENLLLFPNEPEMALSAFVKPVSSNKDSKMSDSQKSALKSFLKHLNPSNMKIIKLSNTSSASENTKVDFEPYKTSYTISKIPLKDSNRNPEDGSLSVSTNKIRELLTCVPEDLNIISVPQNKCPKYVRLGKEMPETQVESIFQPCQIHEEEGISIFWKGPVHEVPEVHLTLVQRLPGKNVFEDVRLGLLGKLHAQIQLNRMEYFLSNHKLCGLELSASYNRGRFIFEIQSYSSNFEKVLEKVTSNIINEKRLPSNSEFESALAQLRSEIMNFSENMAYDIASDLAKSAYLSNYNSRLQLRESLSKVEITYDEYLAKAKDVLASGYFDAFIVGNIEAQKSKTLILNLADSLVSKKIKYEDAAHDGVLDFLGDLYIKTNNPISSDMNNAVVAHFLSPPTDFIDFSVYSSLGEIMNSPFYDTLRTEWQDGYIAFATTISETPIISLVAGVQSAEKKSETLLCHIFSAIDKVSKELEEDLREISKTEFERKIKWFGLSRYSDSKLGTFSGYVEHFSKLIVSHELCFEKNKLIEDATQIFISEPKLFIEKLNKLVKSSDSRKLVVVELVGNPNPEQKDSNSKLLNITKRMEPPSEQDCKKVLDSQLGKSTLIDSLPFKLGSDKQNSGKNGKLRASRNSSVQAENKYTFYDSKSQCSVSESNAISASGKDSNQVKSLLSSFENRVLSQKNKNSTGQDMRNYSIVKDRKEGNSNKRQKRSSCNHNRL